MSRQKYNIEHPDIEGGKIIGITSGVKRILKIPTYTIEPPMDELIHALAILSEHGGRISQKEYIFELEKRGLIKDATGKRGKNKEITKKDMRKQRGSFLKNSKIRSGLLKRGRGARRI